MKAVFAGIAGFVGGVIAGYCVVLFGWIAYTELFDILDREGAKVMGVAFGFAPLGGLLAGIAGAVWAARRVRKSLQG